jgi:holo-[acyl-carrier protein] synthase
MKRKNSSFGVGVDIELIDRFKKFRYDASDAFLRRVYTKKELEYCFAKRNSAEHLAARFAGKEAVRKCLEGLVRPLPAFGEIEILNAKSGAPRAHLKGQKDMRVQISLSHSGEYAVAFALVHTV